MDEGVVLIASSDEPFGEYLYHQMITLGWTISRANLVSDLLRKVREEKVDILLLDNDLEGIPSYDLIPLVKRNNSRLPIIALSEDSSLEMSKKVRLQGIFFLAMKPIDPAEIRAAVGDAIKMLSHKAQRRNNKMAKVIEFRPAKEIDLSKVREICSEHAGKRGDLLIVLQKVQGIFGYVPRPTVEVVAQALGVSTSEILGVLTFYNRFHLSPRGKHTVRACRGTACHFKGAPSIIESIRSHLHLQPGKDTTEDYLFSLEEVACLGACGIAPVMTVDEDTFGNRSPASALEAIAQYEAAEKVAEEVPAEVAEEKKAA
jgi:NADH:ubiquinone oxidoreductase subunit E/CheY-like chemotaxis protein